MRLITRSITAALISCAFSTSWAANTITPQNGNWIISDELNGKPGRGMGIDVQDGIFVMQVYNYNPNGSATFHLATGTVDNNKVVAALKQYKDGPSFGSGAKNGVEVANAGNVEVEFTSRTTATITFPGEATKVMQRFNYEGTPEEAWSDPEYTERWAMVEFDNDNKPVATYWTDIGLGSQLALSPDMHNGWPYADSKNFTVHRFDQAGDKKYAFLECAYTGADHYFACAGQETNIIAGAITQQPTTIRMQRSLDQLKGVVSTGKAGVTRQILGMRVEKTGYKKVDNKIVVNTYFRRNSLPEAGTWIVSTELTGKAGRGISLDVQKPSSALHTLFMPIYNYAKNGDAAFHLGFAVHSPSVIPKPETPYVPLTSYKGGRYFSGPAQDAQVDQYVGQSTVSFASTATGTVQFPDEEQLLIQRYYFGVNQERINSLIGTWALVPHGGMLKTRILNFELLDSGVVRDKENGYTCVMNYWLSFRFVCDPDSLSADKPRIRIATGFYGPSRAIMGDGGSLVDSTPELTVMRITEPNGDLVHAGPLYPKPASGGDTVTDPSTTP